ncbi:pre-rrna processing protein utp22 [Zymoseptoria brevis]|uniref:U3 small nucleolar RNA-associated protein 22 n=1 Tax=Zymoseptoria brevis TaxID=1047168 RepID=A0A0F4GAA6_9PEZI|nr:pre-rrna processing protein utp22 [Zymoseptoria brevis]
MAQPVSKRRKTEHVSSDESEDTASFASFGEDSGGDQSDDETTTSKTKQPTKVAKPAAPRKSTTTTTEAAASAYTSGTFKSNVFKLQLDELLGQTRPKHGKKEKLAETALRQLKQTIEQIPPRGPFTVVEAETDLLRTKVAVPFPDPRPAKDAKFKFAYEKPANINVVGSFALKTASRLQQSLEIDMVVVIPSSLLEEKDFLKHRYFYKRAYYLACIAAGLKKAHKAEYTTRFALFRGDPLKPIVVVEPAVEATSPAPAPKWRINIIAGTAADQFPPTKLRLDKNCVRNPDQDVAAPTPFYNSSLRSDMLVTEYLKLLHGAGKSCESFTEACLLGSTWLRQRNMGSSIEAGGFGNFEWNALMALGLQGGGPQGKPIFSPGYSSYQLFKATLQLLAMKDFAKHPLTVGQAADTPAPLSDGTPIMWDASRGHNLLYKVAQWSYRLLRHEAKSTLIALGDQLYDGFDATFILRVDEPMFRFDYMVQIPERLVLGGNTRTDQHGHVTKLYDVLKQGLGNRVNQICITRPSTSSWALGSSRPSSKNDITIGLAVNQDHVKRAVDHGPPAENKTEAAAFRKFWGDKSELRRFKDGSILESLIWSPSESGQTVLEQIMCYLLNRHFDVAIVEDVKFFGDGFSKQLRGGEDNALFTPFVVRYRQFENDLRDLRDLPLSIRQIMPADPQLCSASILPPAIGKLSHRTVPANVTIQFEGSGRWPDDLVAIQRTKIAFLLMISHMLQETVDSVSCRIGLENDTNPTLNQGYLDVSYDPTTSFRLRIYHDREQTLLERSLKFKSTDPKTRELAALGLAKYKRDYIHRPAQTQSLIRLSTRFPALSGAIRLTKQWFSSHLLSNHIPEEIMELFVVRSFTHPAPWSAPSSVQTGFLRTLFWLSRWDWRVEPLIVDLSSGSKTGGTAAGDNNALRPADLTAITNNFTAWRQHLDPAMTRVALFVASNLDHEGTTWTCDSRPAKVVATRMSSLARAACVEVAAKGLDLIPRALFESPLTDFDFVLSLKDDNNNGRQRKSQGFKNLEMSDEHNSSLIGFNPVQDFLSDLEETYGSAILFFHGVVTAGGGREVIAGLWNPVVSTARRGWKVNLAISTVPILEEEGKEEEGVGKAEGVVAEVNRMAILKEVMRVGGDLIIGVEGLE